MREKRVLPKLRKHATGQGFVVLNGRYLYLGRYELAGTKERYHRLLAEWVANGCRLPERHGDLTIVELIAAYLEYADSYYRRTDGTQTSEPQAVALALKPVRELYGRSPARDFGPRALKAVRQRMIDYGWVRSSINRQIFRIRRVFRWAVAEEMIPASVYERLRTVESLRKGKGDAREAKPIEPVADAHIDAVMPYVSRQVWAMIELQRLTAARPGEVVLMRPGGVDRDGQIWVYRPMQHKTKHLGHNREIYLGPKAQRVLKPFLLRPADSFCFSPAEAEAERLAALHARRRTAISCGNRPGTNRRRRPNKKPGRRYTVSSYGRAIREACLKAGINRWTPHQLRHTAGTNIRKAFSLDVAQAVLGHRSARVTEVYAEVSRQKAIEAMLRMG